MNIRNKMFSSITGIQLASIPLLIALALGGCVTAQETGHVETVNPVAVLTSLAPEDLTISDFEKLRGIATIKGTFTDPASPARFASALLNDGRFGSQLLRLETSPGTENANGTYLISLKQ